MVKRARHLSRESNKFKGRFLNSANDEILLRGTIIRLEYARIKNKSSLCYFPAVLLASSSANRQHSFLRHILFSPYPVTFLTVIPGIHSLSVCQYGIGDPSGEADVTRAIINTPAQPASNSNSVLRRLIAIGSCLSHRCHCSPPLSILIRCRSSFTAERSREK